MNNRIIRDAINEAKRILDFGNLHFIVPVQTPYKVENDNTNREFASIPEVTCVAELYHYDVFRDMSKTFSAVGILWFQDNYAFPIDSNILDKIIEIPFSKICIEFDP